MQHRGPHSAQATQGFGDGEDMRAPTAGWKDRSDVSRPARPLAQELWELSSRRAYTLTRLALALDLWLGAEGYSSGDNSYQA
jgi:hypothetical protein